MKVCVLRKIPGPAIDLLKQQGFEVVEGLENVVGSEAVLSLLTDKIDGELMELFTKRNQL